MALLLQLPWLADREIPSGQRFAEGGGALQYVQSEASDRNVL